MFDIILQIMILSVGIPCMVLTSRVQKDWFNPVTIVFVSFFVPMFFALFRLAGIQSHEWAYETYVALMATVGAWIVLPTLVLYIVSPYQGRFFEAQSLNLEDVSGKFFGIFVRLFALSVIAAFFVSNYIQVKTFFPITLPEEAFHLHTEFPSGLRFFARASPAAAVLLYVLFYTRRSKLDLLLLALVVFTPLSRLARIDLALSMVGLGLVYMRLPLFAITKARLALMLLAIVGLMIGGAEIGNLRQNRFGVYEFKYSEFIRWQPTIVGPAEIFPVLYGYFPLSFENFDAFIRQFRGGHSYVMLSFDWLFTGFIKMNWIPGFIQAQANAFQFTPISSAANVPTALSPFYADAGPIGMVVPLSIYMTFLVYVYKKSKSSVAHLVVFSFYSGAFALSSFQAIIAAPFIAHQIVEIAGLIALARYFDSRQQRRRALRLEPA